MSEFGIFPMASEVQPSESSARGRPASRRVRRSTTEGLERLSNMISTTTNKSRARTRRPATQGKKAHAIPRPSKKSGLNPSGIPYSSQLNRPSETIQTIPPLTSDTTSAPSFRPIPGPTPSINLNSIYNPMAFTNLDSVYNPTMTQSQNNNIDESTELVPHYDEPLPYTSGPLPDDNLSSLFPPSLSDIDPGGYILGEPGSASTSRANLPDYLVEQPLRPGEVTRGGITPPLPPSIWRTTAAGAGRLSGSSGTGGVIRGSGRPTDVLSNRHAKRAPYRLPPTPAPSQDAFEDSFRVSPLVPAVEGTSAQTAPQLWPEGVGQVVAHAKRHFRLKLLMTNAMWPDITAYVQAKDQLKSSCSIYKMEARWPQIDEVAIRKVLHEGSYTRNEFKNTARHLVLRNCYEIFPPGPHHQILNPEDKKRYIAQKVSALLDGRTGAWMHNGKDEQGATNYFEHPAVEEIVITVLFSSRRSVGCRHLDQFTCVPIPTLALACCALRCALEEWEDGTYLPINFEAAMYRSLYESIMANFHAILRSPYLNGKLNAFWARIHDRGGCIASNQIGRNARTVNMFVEDVMLDSVPDAVEDLVAGAGAGLGLGLGGDLIGY